MENRKHSIKAFANYLRDKLTKPADWDTNLFGEFPGTVSMFQKYFGYILKHFPDSEKARAIESHYVLEKFSSVEKKIQSIDGKPRSIEKFFREGICPYEKNLNFIAEVFDFPIKTVEEYVTKIHLSTAPLTSKLEELTTPHTTNIEQSEPLEPSTNSITTSSILEESHIKESSINPTRRLSWHKVAIGLVLLIIIPVLWLLIDLNTTTQNNLYATVYNEAKFNTSLPIDIGEKLFVGNIKPDKHTIIEQREDLKLEFYTTNIFNDKCLYTNSSWTFETDSIGEDMNSKYGTPFNEDIQTLHPIIKGRTTIANQFMDVHFNINNKSSHKLFFTTFSLKILDSYDAKAERAEYNLYQMRSNEIRFEVVLTDQNTYAYTTNKELIESGGSLFCRLRVKGDDTCNGLIYKYKIECNLIDTEGNHYTVESDKSYFIGFVLP